MKLPLPALPCPWPFPGPMKGLGGQRPGPDNSPTRQQKPLGQGVGTSGRCWERHRKRGGGNPTAGQADPLPPALPWKPCLAVGGNQTVSLGWSPPGPLIHSALFTGHLLGSRPRANNSLAPWDCPFHSAKTFMTIASGLTPQSHVAGRAMIHNPSFFLFFFFFHNPS